MTFPKASLKKLRCLTCGSPHNGSVGAGKFCTIACSKRVGARARWSGHKRARGSANANRAVLPPVLARAEPDTDAEHGLCGERVVVSTKQSVVRGWIKEYAPAGDRHCVVNEKGKLFWLDLRKCKVEFVDEDDAS